MDELKILVLLVGSGLLFRMALIFTGQLWAKSHAQTVSFLVLPLITYVITNTIANNIAASTTTTSTKDQTKSGFAITKLSNV